MKKVINLVLGLCALALLYLCYSSIMEPINFNKEKDLREAAVKERLIQIRDAEEQYRLQKGEFCDSFPELIAFIKEGKVPFINKVGELTDEQMDKGLTEAKAAAIVNSGNAAAIAANGLQHFRRDTSWISLCDTIFGRGFVADSIQYIPYSQGKVFKLEKSVVVNKSGTVQNVMECSATYDDYLNGLSPREVGNLKDMADKTERFPGLKIGDLYTANNNAGNWE